MTVESVAERRKESIRARIAIDAMGGDHAPEAIVGGALQAVLELPVDIILVGVRERLEPLIQGAEGADRLTIHHASSYLDERAPRRSGQTAEGFVDRRRRPPRQGGRRRRACERGEHRCGDGLFPS